MRTGQNILKLLFNVIFLPRETELVDIYDYHLKRSADRWFDNGK